MAPKKEMRKYSYKTHRIFRILLSHPRLDITPYRLAKEVGIATSWVYHILKELESYDVADGTYVTDPYELFMIWASQRPTKRYREYHLQKPRQILQETPMKYALTTYFAENLVGNYVFPRIYDIYIRPEDMKQWDIHLRQNGYVGRGNFRTFIDDTHVFYNHQKIDGYRLVSIQQLIVDLLLEGGECVEAAELLIEDYYDDY